MKVKIIADLETSDHDGYCSGEECLYEIKEETFFFEVEDDKSLELDNPFWKTLLPVPDLGGQSYYCGIDDESIERGLDIHDYRYTIKEIIKVE